MPDNDAQLEIKKRARRRLVGAVALALAAAIILPMVMDKEPRSTGNDLQIRIPSQEGGNYTSRLIASTASAPVAVPAEPAGDASAPAERPMPATSAPAVVPPKPAAAPAVSAPAANSTPVGAAPKSEAPPPPHKPDAAARARALLDGGEPAPTAADNHKYFIQLGVYRDAENAKSVRAHAKSAGFASTTEAVGHSTRVRVGPFSDREAADRALAKLKKAGLNNALVVPAK